MRNGYEFPEKKKTSHFLISDIWADIYVVFIGHSQFLSIKPTVFKNSAPYCNLIKITSLIWVQEIG